MVRNYAVAPGEYLKEWMDENGDITQEALSRRVGISRKTLNEILNGKATVSESTALRLEKVTGIRASVWLRHEAEFREEVARLKEENSLAYYANRISSHVANNECSDLLKDIELPACI